MLKELGCFFACFFYHNFYENRSGCGQCALYSLQSDYFYDFNYTKQGLVVFLVSELQKDCLVYLFAMFDFFFQFPCLQHYTGQEITSLTGGIGKLSEKERLGFRIYIFLECLCSNSIISGSGSGKSNSAR